MTGVQTCALPIYSVEDELLGTGGAVRQALSLVEPGLCFVLNGDTWVDLDYAAMYREHLAANARLSIAVKEIDDVSRFGTLQISNRHITGFLEKGSCGQGVINAGVYLMPTDLLADQALPKVFSLEQDFFMPQLSSLDRKSTRLNSSHIPLSRMPSSA